MDKILNYCLRRFNFIIDAYIHIHIQMSRMSLTVNYLILNEFSY